MFMLRHDAALEEAKSLAAQSEAALAQQHADELVATIADYKGKLELAGEKAAREVERIRKDGETALAAAHAEGCLRSDQAKSNHATAVRRWEQERDELVANMNSAKAEQEADLRERHRLELSELQEQHSNDHAILNDHLQHTKVSKGILSARK
jgi:guanylate kinase